MPLCFAAFGLLLYITFKPLFEKRVEKASKVPHGAAATLSINESAVYNRIAICIDFSSMDSLTIQSGISQGGKAAAYILLHVVETAGAHVYGSEISDMESKRDEQALKDYASQLQAKGYNVETDVGYGNPKVTIPVMVRGFNADLLVMGAHGHRLFKDLILGTTVDSVRHRVGIPVLIVQG
jgi:manganese transport protein